MTKMQQGLRPHGASSLFPVKGLHGIDGFAIKPGATPFALAAGFFSGGVSHWLTYLFVFARRRRKSTFPWDTPPEETSRGGIFPSVA